MTQSSERALQPSRESRAPLAIEPYGWFDEEAREFVVARADAPRPWLNPLLGGRLLAQASHLGGGDVWLLPKDDAAPETAPVKLLAGRGDRALFDGGWRFYVRDRATGAYWSPTPRPPAGRLDAFECRHGLGCTTYSSASGQTVCRLSAFAPPGRDSLAWSLSLTNRSGVDAVWDIFAFVSVDDAEDAAIRSGHHAEGDFMLAEPRRRRPENAPALFLASNQPIFGFEASPSRFVGSWRSESNPQAVEAGRCGNGEAAFGPVAMAIQVGLSLPAGASSRADFLLGAVDPGRDAAGAARAAIEAFRKPGAVDSWREESARQAAEALAEVQAELPDPLAERALNTWGAWQAACSGKARARLPLAEGIQAAACAPAWTSEAGGPELAFRQADNALALARGRSELLPWSIDLLCRTALEFGPAGRRALEDRIRRADALLGFLESSRVADSLDFSESEVVEPLRAARLAWALDKLGRLREVALEDAPRWSRTRQRLLQAIANFGWTGQWLRPEGPMAAAPGAEPGRLSLDAQSWAALSGAVSGDRAARLLDLAFGTLDSPGGLLTLAGPFAERGASPASLDPPGHGANGGVDLRSVAWAIMADCHVSGNGARSVEAFGKILPMMNSKAAPEAYAAEPCWFASNVAGPASLAPGKGFGAGLNAAAGWLRRAMLEHVVGLRAEWNGLRLSPCLPPEWKEVVVRRRFRGAAYQIFIENPEGRSGGVRSMTLDGEPVEGSLIPFEEGSGSRVVRAVL